MSEKKPFLDSQTYITLGYLTIVLIGMMFDYKYYNHFDINIFEYADILDFLLAPVKNFELILFAAASLIAVLIFFQIDKLWQDRWPKSYKRFNFGMSTNALKKYRPYIIVLSALAYLNLASEFYGDRMFKRFEEAPKEIEIVFQSDERVLKGKLIGKNADYVIMQTDDQAVKAIPVSSDVQEIIIHR